jgi:hypothetical protein
MTWPAPWAVVADVQRFAAMPEVMYAIGIRVALDIATYRLATRFLVS